MTIHEEVISMMQSFAEKALSQGIKLELPPPTVKTFGAEFVGLDKGKSLTVRFPYQAQFANPTGAFQGGMLIALIDDVFGPLSYMATQKPCATVHMNCNFIRPFTARDASVEVTARVVSRSVNLLLLEAEVKTLDGRLIATAGSHAFPLSS